uniref:CSON006818 protein n=1 Tax=Culicoides sonorensis TaxID=179676 RepID=A0A336KEA7_CULSO
MRFFVILKIIFLLLIGTYANNLSCGSTVLDCFKDNYQNIYHYSYYFAKRISDDTEILDKFNCYTYIREASSNRQIIMNLKNIESNEKITPLLLPVLATTSQDEDTSVNQKHQIIYLMLHNYTETVKLLPDALKYINNLRFDLSINGSLFGYCKFSFNCYEKDKSYVIELSTKKEKCEGRIDKSIINTIGSSNLMPNSELKLENYFNKHNMTFEKSVLNVNAFVTEHPYRLLVIKKELSFIRQEIITEKIDETIFQKIYNASNLQ